MDFSTPQELLGYLVEVSDDRSRQGRLLSGRELMDLAREEGRIAAANRDREEAAFARLLFALKDSGSVGFTEWPGHERPNVSWAFEGRHAESVTEIYVTSNGRLAVQGSAIQAMLAALAANVGVFLDAVDARVDEVIATPEHKAEAHAALRGIRDVATSTVGSVIGAALSAHLKSLGP